jgi:hypothetical protein
MLEVSYFQELHIGNNLQKVKNRNTGLCPLLMSVPRRWLKVD